MNHRIGRVVFATIVGLLVATLSYRWITNPDNREERVEQEHVVASSRLILRSIVTGGEIEVVDAMAPNRKAGKVYVYREGDGWAVSGYYRRSEDDRWHPFLMLLDSSRQLTNLKVQDRDPELVERAASDPLFEVSP